MLKSAKSNVFVNVSTKRHYYLQFWFLEVDFSWIFQQDFTSVQQPLADGLRHVERQPLALRAGAHHLAVNVALRGRREVLVT